MARWSCLAAAAILMLAFGDNGAGAEEVTIVVKDIYQGESVYVQIVSVDNPRFRREGPIFTREPPGGLSDLVRILAPFENGRWITDLPRGTYTISVKAFGRQEHWNSKTFYVRSFANTTVVVPKHRSRGGDGGDDDGGGGGDDD